MTDARDEGGAGVEGGARAVVFLFSDVEGSTRLLERDEAATIRALDRLGELLRRAVASDAGTVFRFTGDGLHATFESPVAAMRAAIAAQAAVRAEDWGSIGRLRVRMAIHAGDAEPRGTDWTGPALFRCARLLELAHGGQVVVSGAAARDGVPTPTGRLHSRGTRVLRDLRQPEDVFELVAPGAAPDPRPLRGEDRRPGDPTTTPVGRAGDLDALTAAFDADRLVTVTGLGGTGKTTLARAFAAGRDDDRTWFIELVGAASPGDVPAAVAGALGAGESGDEDLETAIIEALGEAPGMLVLDNMEHVLGAAPFVARLLDAVPSLRILVTSRQALGIDREVTVRLAPLALPGPDDALDEAPASRVFLDRARERGALRSLTPDDADAVRELCGRLDGLPLALELAARWTTLLAPRAILRRLDERRLALAADPLTGTSLDRHTSLEEVVESTLTLVQPADQPVFDAFGPFAGPAPEAALASVAGDDDVLPSLLRLEAVGLVRVRARDDGEPRFDVLQPVRDVATRRLSQAGMLDVARRRHAEWFGATALDAVAVYREASWTHPQAGEVLADPNLSAAYAHAMALGDASLAASTAASLATRAFRDGVTREPLRRIEAALALGPVRPEIEADALNIVANAYAFVFGRDVAELTARAVEAARASRDVTRIVRTLNTQASHGSTDAIGLLQEAAALADAAGFRWGSAVSHGNLANVLLSAGRYDEALAAVRRARQPYVDAGDEVGTAVTLATEAGILAHLGRSPEARVALRRADEIRRRPGMPLILVHVPIELAILEAENDARDDALALLLEAAAFRAESDSLEDAANWVGAAAIVLGDAHPVLVAQALGMLGSHPSPNDVPLDLARRSRVAAAVERALGRRRYETALEDGRSADVLALASRLESAIRRDVPAAHGRIRGAFGTLSAREQEVLRLLADGATDAEIGERLGISPKTASVHVLNLKGKLGADTRVGAVLAAQRLLGEGRSSPVSPAIGRAGASGR